MTIIRRKNEGKNHEFWFNNGAWVNIGEDNASYEYEVNNNENTYIEGSLIIEGRDLIDYDGCYELPKEVELALSELGVEVCLDEVWV